MSRKWIFLSACFLAILMISSLQLPAQTATPVPPAGDQPQGQFPPPQRFGQWPQGGIGFLRFEAALGNRVVKGEPYSAQVTVEHTETLADGTNINRRNTFTVYRDSQGRTRRELTLPAIGSYTALGEPPQVIFINDPVAGVRYVLDPKRKTARRFRLPEGRPPARRMRRNQRNTNVNTTSLGSKTLEGIRVQGTQTTRTIPADRIGNNKPIEIVTTRWYAPDLHVNVQTTTRDPMRGDTTLSLTKISRGEPEAALFEVPAGYSVQAGGFPAGRQRGGSRGRFRRR